MSSPPATKRAKKSDDKENALEQWFQNASSEEVLDRWFSSSGNFDGSRYNWCGDWIGHFDGPTDWNDFEDCLDRIPALAAIKEGDVSIIFHCCYVSNPPVPASVMRKLVKAKPALLRERQNNVADPDFISDDELRGDLNVLQVYLEAPSWVIDSWDVDYEVAKVLVDADPKLLFHEDNKGEITLEAFLWRFPEKRKELLLELQKNASAEESKQIEEALRVREKREKEIEEEEENSDGEE